MHRTLVVTAGLGIALALLYLVGSSGYPLGTAAEPGSGLYPTLVGVLMLICSVGVGVEVARHRPPGDVAWPGGAARMRVLTILAATVGYAVLLPYIGHLVGGSLVALAVLHAMGLPRLRLKIGLALAVGLVSYYLFAMVLKVPLPAGISLG